MDFTITRQGVVLDRRKLMRLRKDRPESGAEVEQSEQEREHVPARDEHPLHRIVFLSGPDPLKH